MPHRVFIIHGRDIAARDELVKFVRSLGLEWLSFDDAAKGRGPSPFIADIVRNGVRQADAVIALFTPDEHAALYDEAGEYQGQGTARWQARPNVIFEAGVAYGIARKKTILVTLGADVELFSDVHGIHFIRLDSRAESYENDPKDKLLDRLRSIKGLEGVAPARADWKQPAISGDFSACLRPRWAYYDELGVLEANLRTESVTDDGADHSLLDIVQTVVIDPEYAETNWDACTSEDFMGLVSDKFNESVAEDAYWWFLVYGFLRFSTDHPWWDGEAAYENSVEFSELAERGKALISKLMQVHA